MKNETETFEVRRKNKVQTKIKEICIIGAFALALVIATWEIFYSDKNEVTSVASMSESEKKVMQILREIEGVGSAEVMICENEDGVSGVVVVCDGANNFQVVLDIREAVATALGTKQSSVKIYLKKE